MQELQTMDIEQVNGGILPLVIGALATDAFAIGFTAGAITGYKTVESLLKSR